MRRMIPLIALAVAACNPPADSGNAPGDEPAVQPVAPTDDSYSSPSSTTQEPENQRPEKKADGSLDLTEETDLFLFSYKYPAAAGKIPALSALLDKREETARAQLSREAAEARSKARDSGFPYNKHSYQAEWKVVASTRDWLSLSQDFSTYSGGAHGNHGMDTLVWDRLGQRQVKVEDFFTSPQALYDAVETRFCAGLDKERAKRRTADFPADRDDIFWQCPKMDELLVLLGSSNSQKFDRLTFYAGPYVAGPYVEGAYQVHLSVNKAVLAVVEPQYRDSFRARN